MARPYGQGASVVIADKQDCPADPTVFSWPGAGLSWIGRSIASSRSSSSRSAVALRTAFAR